MENKDAAIMAKVLARRPNSLTITFLANVSMGSLNGSQKDVDNVSSIKKETRDGEQYPYLSGQAIRHAFRETLGELGNTLSAGQVAVIKKGAATTQIDPAKYVDDDILGFMSTEMGKIAFTRTSIIRVSPLLGLSNYHGDLDYGTNYMAKDAGGDPNIFETETHSGTYRGTILIELDRIGQGEGFKTPLDNATKANRVCDLLDAIMSLWSSGRQSRFLTDISPKFVAAALMRVKNPIFLESVIPAPGGVNTDILAETVSDFQSQIVHTVFGARSALYTVVPEGTVSVGAAFAAMKTWVRETYV